jgi:hypothetical protein
VSVDPRSQLGGGGSQAILLRGQHANQLTTPCEERLQELLLDIGEGPRLRVDGGGIQGKDACIEIVGLGELSDRFGEVADVAWVDHGDGDASLLQRTSERAFETAASFDDDQCHVQREELTDEFRQRLRGVRDTPGRTARGDRDIEPL